MVSGSCAASGGNATLKPVTWATEGVACALPKGGGTCPGCSPRPPPPFVGWCVWRADNTTCPSAFPKRHAWVAADDTRDCAPCTCGAPGTTCSVVTSLYSDTSCKTELQTIQPSTQCTDQVGVGSVSVTATLMGSPSCAPSGGTPMGGVDSHVVATICCAP
jgi:hypothetical protein